MVAGSYFSAATKLWWSPVFWNVFITCSWAPMT